MDKVRSATQAPALLLKAGMTVKADARPNTPSAERKKPWTIGGFGDKVRIATAFGEVPAMLLRKNDTIRDKSGTIRRITWLDRVHLDEDFMRRHPEANPVLIRAGALGRGVPARDIEVSPCQELLVSTMHSTKSVRADALLGRPNIMQVGRNKLSYTRFSCDSDVTFKVEQIWAPAKS